MNTRILSVAAGLSVCVAMIVWSTWDRVPPPVSPGPAHEAPIEQPVEQPLEQPGFQPTVREEATAKRSRAAPPHVEPLEPSAAAATTESESPDSEDARTGTGKLTVQFLEPSGGPAVVRGTLAWSRHLSIGAGHLISPAGELAVHGSTAVLEGLDAREALTLQMSEPGRLDVEQTVRFPEGQLRHEVTLVRGLQAPILEIPIVDQDGKPVTDVELLVFVKDDKWFPEWFRETPDEQGLLRVTLARPAAGKIEIGQPHNRDELHVLDGKPLARPYGTMVGEPVPDVAHAVRAFPFVAAGNVQRLERVVVHRARPRIRGTVIGLDGKPAAGIRILVGARELPEPAWFRHYETKSDARGNFAVVAGNLPETVYLCARGPTSFTVPLLHRTDRKESLTMQLLPTGTLSLSARAAPHLAELRNGNRSGVAPKVELRIDQEALRDGWWTLFRQPGIVTSRTGPVWHKKIYMRGPAPLVCPDLLPNTYSIDITARGNRAIPTQKVRIRSGETVSPASIRDLVVGGELANVTVTVRNPDGTIPNQAFVVIKLPESAHTNYYSRTASTDERGIASFVLPRSLVADVEVQSYGRMTQLVRAASFPLQVVLDAGTQLAVQIDGIANIAGARRIRVNARKYDDRPPLSPIMSQPEGLWAPHATVDRASGRGSLSNLEPGKYRVWLISDSASGKVAPRVLMLRDIVIAEDGKKTVDLRHQLTFAESNELSW